MAETMALLATLPVRIGASVFYLTPGAPMAPAPEDISGPDMVRARSTAMAAEGKILKGTTSSPFSSRRGSSIS